jgi:hypothetical protein
MAQGFESLGRVAQYRSLLLAGACLLTCLGGCATVAVYEPVAAAEIDLAGPGFELQRAARTYCETARGKGLATGEASLKSFADSMFGTGVANEPYHTRIGAETRPPLQVVRALRGDVADLAGGLQALNAQASGLMRAARPTKEDVSEFERVLIHAGQGRESLSIALGKLSPRMDVPLVVGDELRELDRAVARAQGLADELAAARLAEPLVLLLAAPGPA